MAHNRVITISRSFGSGGRAMGQMLARELDWTYYDTELLQLASDESGIMNPCLLRPMRRPRSRCCPAMRSAPWTAR